MRLLLVEDEPKMASLLRSGLRDEGVLVDVAVNGREGVWAATEEAYDVMIIDVMLPDLDGFDVCRRIRSTDETTPILMLTARGAVGDRVAGLDAGADDYLVKPFAFDELLARLRALLRRGPVSRPRVLAVGDLRLDPVGRRVWRGEQEVVLTAQEFSLLQALVRRPGQVLSRQQLTHLAWDTAREEHSNIVDACVRGLRNRVDRPFGRHSVQTVRGVGYRLSADDS
jgi:two-component system OmpR family response regulator